MLARKLQIKLEDVPVGTTPMLVPSLSSRATSNIKKAAETIGSIISGPVLISAYDEFYAKILPIISPSCSLLFIDSGGYECSVGYESSEHNLYNLDLREWNEKLHLETVKCLGKKPPKVIISYDHPVLKIPIEEQIERANSLFKETNGYLREFLIKSETKNEFICIERVLENITKLKKFDIIGLIEKELGPNVLERMIAIAKIRSEMDHHGISKPLHIFGSLDTITTPPYYFSGGDIFDGLSWTRYIFHQGRTLYRDSFGPSNKGIISNASNIMVSCYYENYNYMRELEMILEQFESTKGEDFKIFDENEKFFKKSYLMLAEKMKGAL